MIKRLLFFNLLISAAIVITASISGCSGGTTSVTSSKTSQATTLASTTTPTATTRITTKPSDTTPPTTTTQITTTPTPSVTAPPSQFSLFAPGANSIENSVAPEFTWKSAKGADSYNLEVATSRSFGETTVISQTGIKETSFKTIEPLAWTEVYYWRVTAVNKGGETICSQAPFWFCTELPIELPAKARGPAMATDGERLIVVYEQTPGKLVIISPGKTPEITREFTTKDEPEWIEVTGRFAIAYSDTGWLSIVDLSNFTLRYCAVPKGVPYRNNMGMTPDGQTLIYDDMWSYPGDSAEHLYLINLIDLSITRGVAIGESKQIINVTAMAVTPDGNTILAATWQGNLIFVDIVSGARSVMTLDSPGVYWRDIKVTPDGKTAVVTTDDSVLLVDIAARQIETEIKISGLSDIDMLPDGKHIVAVAEYRVLIMSVETGVVTNEYKVDNFRPRVVVTPDGKKAIILKSNNSFISNNNTLYYIPLEQP